MTPENVFYTSTPFKTTKIETLEPPEIVRDEEPIIDTVSIKNVSEFSDILDKVSDSIEEITISTTLKPIEPVSTCEPSQNNDIGTITTNEGGDLHTDTNQNINYHQNENISHQNFILIFLFNILMCLFFYGQFIYLKNEIEQLREIISMSTNEGVLLNQNHQDTQVSVHYNIWQDFLHYIINFFGGITENILNIFKH